ncbi:uncharacterized protein LOC120074677 [Benincasa hispida]|uniref:uncharacterized protein LOC120074677 n=1 Tax=Benincasa hispida TaxID=102211 RepID=UPI0018FF8071|nr:uncharacterized protein LOC120074677 [Benincasa hispida]
MNFLPSSCENPSLCFECRPSLCFSVAVSLPLFSATRFSAPLLSHPNANGLRNKSFPFYEQLAIIFRKDRANGLGAEGPADMFDAIEREMDNNDFWRDECGFYVPDPPIVGGEEVDGPTSMSEATTNIQSSAHT